MKLVRCASGYSTGTGPECIIIYEEEKEEMIESLKMEEMEFVDLLNQKLAESRNRNRTATDPYLGCKSVRITPDRYNIRFLVSRNMFGIEPLFDIMFTIVRCNCVIRIEMIMRTHEFLPGLMCEFGPGATIPFNLLGFTIQEGLDLLTDEVEEMDPCSQRDAAIQCIKLLGENRIGFENGPLPSVDSI